MTCKRKMTIVRYPFLAAGRSIAFPRDTAELTIRAVSAANVPIDFSLRRRLDSGADGPEFHFVAGEVCTLADLMLEGTLTLVVASASGSVEVLYWTE